MGTSTVRTRGSSAPPWLILAGAAAIFGMAVLWLVAIQGVVRAGRSGPSAPTAGSERFSYVQFGIAVDTVYTASAEAPQQRTEAFEAPHAASYGIVASLSPDGKHIAYNALPPETARPTPDSPADVWVAALDGSRGPTLVASGADLLVRPVWSPSGNTLVFRRSTPQPGIAGDFRLSEVDLVSLAVRDLVLSPGAALFPVGFGPGGGVLYYVRLEPAASDLFALDVGAVEPRFVARLADYLTRDWALSPQGSRLAYLALVLDGGTASSRALVLDLETRQVAPAGSGPGAEFSPVWSATGDELTVGRLTPGAAASGVARRSISDLPALPAPRKGFDVPLAWSSAGGRLAVRAFDGDSITNPGRSTLVLIDESGKRLKIADGEVTFLGWISH